MVSETLTSSAVINTRVNFRLILDELVLFLRNNLTDRRSRALSNTETFTGDDTTTTFTLTGDLDSRDRHKIMNVKSLIVAGTSQTFYSDYIVGFRKSSPDLGKIRFWNAPANAASISIRYQYAYHFVFPESPRVDLTTNAYPRVSVQLFNTFPKDVAIGGKVTKHDIIVQITVVDEKRDYTEDLIMEIKNLFVRESIKHGFFNFDYIMEPKLTPLVPNGEDPNDTVYVQQVELRIPNQYEFSK